MIPTIDPEFSALIPPLAPDELAQLEANILRDGCREPLTVWRGLLLDGHNRLTICQRHGVTFETVGVELASRDEAKVWIIDNQMGRRNLPKIDAINLQMQREPIIARLAKVNQTQSQGRGVKGLPNLVNLNPVNTQFESAKMAGVSHGTYDAGKRVIEAVQSGALPADAIARIRDGKESISGVAKQFTRSANREEKIAAIVANNLPLDGTLGKFSVIYADPPWRYDHPISDSRKIENQYPTMYIDDICALPVADICADDTILFLWASTPMLKKGLQVMEAWGFEYRTSMVWIKPSIGPGQWVRQRHELLLIGIKGNIPTPRGADKPDSVIEAPRQEHSKKPDVVYEIIEKMYPELARVELFCRAPREGWSVWGNQS